MKRLLTLVVAVVCCLSLLGSTCFAAPQRVAGRIVNGTRDGKPAAGATVELIRVDQEKGTSQTLAKAKAGADGAFDMGRLELPAKELLFARAVWQGFPYIVPAYDGGGQLEGFTVRPDRLELEVFDTSKEAPQLAFTVQHLAIKSEGQNLKCIERIVVENPSRSTYIGEGKEAVTILLPLPKGAREPEIDPTIADAKLIKVGQVYGVSKPIMPAAARARNVLIVEYTLPWAKEVDLSRRLQYPVRFFFVAREESDRELKINAPQLGADETTQLPIDESMESRIINSKGNPQNTEAAFAPGAEIKILVSRPTNPLVWTFVCFVVVLCLAVPAALLLGRRKGAATEGGSEAWDNLAVPAELGTKIAEPAVHTSVIPPIPSERGETTVTPEAREWIEKIARLDDDWEAGKLAQDDYRSQRLAWKQKAVDSMSAATSEKTLQ